MFADRCQEASWKLFHMVQLVPHHAHDDSCDQYCDQTDEFKCTCWVHEHYVEIRQVLIDASKLV